jgi:hypothetical protein
VMWLLKMKKLRQNITKSWQLLAVKLSLINIGKAVWELIRADRRMDMMKLIGRSEHTQRCVIIIQCLLHYILWHI